MERSIMPYHVIHVSLPGIILHLCYECFYTAFTLYHLPLPQEEPIS